jgi:hypothetical protein
MIAGSMGVATDAAFPLGLLAVGTPAVIVVVNLIGAIPARSAGRLPVADALRSEWPTRARELVPGNVCDLARPVRCRGCTSGRCGVTVTRSITSM